MKKRIYSSCIRSLMFILVGTVPACVSIDIKDDKIQRSSKIEFKAPQKPFVSFSQDQLDQAWYNPENGNSISYLSECNSHSDPSFSSIRNGIIYGVQKRRVLREDFIEYNNRRALNSTVIGSVDGIQTKFNIIVLKKNNCIYVLTYVGLETEFTENQDSFLSFLKGFKAP